MQKVLAKNRFLGYTLGMKKFEVTIQYSISQRASIWEVEAKGIRWAIESACKDMKEAYPYFIENVDFAITKIEEK